MKPVFAELHARSAFSFLRGASSPEEMITRAAALGLEHLALTDRDGVYGSARAHHKARELGLRAIVGAELTMEDGGVLPVLVRTRTGYQNLCRLLTRSKLAAPKGQARVTWPDLEEHAAGLTALTGDEEGVLQQAWEKGGKKGPEPNFRSVREMFKPKFNVSIPATEGFHDLYFVVKNPDIKPGQILIQMESIVFGKGKTEM